ncbi:MAG: ROK family protein [Candidatus Omnitrophica bacterium]|nr:ROK family protein [Candidatus Omnitrophota bacterium]
MYIGIDIGGTKIAGALVDPGGDIAHRTKIATPAGVKAKDIYLCVVDSIDELMRISGGKRSRIKGIGLGIPGIVDTRNDHILAAPNIRLTGFPLSARLKRKFRVPVAMTNDVNAGLLGEAWLGAAKGLDNVVGLFPGTGVGGAVIAHGRLLLGAQGAATELGHMIMDVNGPLCHCGNRGCLEALTSRWAVERDIRMLIRQGRRSIVTRLNKGRLIPIKSRILKEALYQKDPVVRQVMTQVSLDLGKAGISINHIFNPRAILLGGGVIKACGWFMLPIIAKTLKSDPFFKSFNTCRILQSTLGDDAVPLGAARLLQHGFGRS